MFVDASSHSLVQGLRERTYGAGPRAERRTTNGGQSTRDGAVARDTYCPNGAIQSGRCTACYVQGSAGEISEEDPAID